MTPYISLDPRAKNAVIFAVCAMFLGNFFQAFAVPVAMPALLQGRGMMAQFALLAGLGSLIICIVTPIGGKLGDKYGRRTISLWALGLRSVLLTLCALPTPGPVFFALFLAATAASGFISAAPFAILGDITTSAERLKWFGVLGTLNGLVLILGIVGGGVISDLFGPASIFFLFAPLGLMAMIPLAKYYPNRPGKQAALDKIGIVFLTIGLSCLIVWANFGGVFGRLSPVGITLLAVGIGVICLLIRHEWRVPDPLINPRFFKRREFQLSCLVFIGIAPMATLSSSTLVLFGQVGLGLSATMSGTLALPKNIIFLLLPAILSRWMAVDERRFRPVFLFCGITIAIASIFSSMWGADTNLILIYVVLAVFGLGTSAQSVTIQPYMQRKAPPEDLGSATSVLIFVSTMGFVLYNLIQGIVFNAQYAANTLPGGGGESQAVLNTFTTMSFVSLAGGLLVLAATLALFPRHKRSETDVGAE
ncbi:MAG: MFS transporter [Oscillospiraceae bacterium]|nr:MFS transporter [Oscillospiraceae bacterium]